MAEERGFGVSDHVHAQMVECVPEPEVTAEALPKTPESAQSPTVAAMEATLTQTGADPPPVVLG
jgi:hypothetical protein